MINENYRQKEIEQATKTLSEIGITMLDENGNYRPFNEVIIDLAKTFRNLRNIDEFELIRDHVLQSLCGLRYKNEFKY